MTKSMHVSCLLHCLPSPCNESAWSAVDGTSSFSSVRWRKAHRPCLWTLSAGSNTAETMNDLWVTCQTHRGASRTRTHSVRFADWLSDKAHAGGLLCLSVFNFYYHFAIVYKTICRILPCTVLSHHRHHHRIARVDWCCLWLATWLLRQGPTFSDWAL